MTTDIIMPRLTDSMEEGTVVQWLKSVSDQVREGDPLVEIETDKAVLEYPSDVDGVLLSIDVSEGETASIGTVIGQVGSQEACHAGAEAGHEDKEPAAVRTGVDDSTPQAEAPSRSGGPATAASPATTGGSPGPPGVPPRRDGLPPTSPLARRLAADHGVDLAAISGTGPEGRITRRDVETAARTKVQGEKKVTDGKGAVEIVELSHTQRTIAQRMSVANTEVPHFYLDIDADVTELLAVRARFTEHPPRRSAVPSINDFILRAVALVLREQPRVNAAWNDGKVERYGRVNVGTAVSVDDVLLVPTVHDADQKSVRDIAEITAQLSVRARDGALQPADVSDGTFTVTNLGMYGVTSFSPIINSPQAAILAVGAAASRPVFDEQGSLAAREIMTLTLAGDHRVVYGADGAVFLSRLRELIEDPYLLLT